VTLSTKFNLVLLSVFVIGLIVVGYVSNYVLQKNAREEVLRHASLMMQAALSMRSYTVTGSEIPLVMPLTLRNA
jgi:protein-histidine pros-kinase